MGNSSKGRHLRSKSPAVKGFILPVIKCEHHWKIACVTSCFFFFILTKRRFVLPVGVPQVGDLYSSRHDPSQMDLIARRPLVVLQALASEPLRGVLNPKYYFCMWFCMFFCWSPFGHLNVVDVVGTVFKAGPLATWNCHSAGRSVDTVHSHRLFSRSWWVHVQFCMPYECCVITCILLFQAT